MGTLGNSRYGQEVLRTPQGSWFWSPALQLLAFVPAGKRSSRREETLSVQQNSLAGAVRKACLLAAEAAREGSR